MKNRRGNKVTIIASDISAECDVMVLFQAQNSRVFVLDVICCGAHGRVLPRTVADAFDADSFAAMELAADHATAARTPVYLTAAPHKAFYCRPDRTTSDLAASYMAQKTKDCIANGVFSVDYGKIPKSGFHGVIAEAALQRGRLDDGAPEASNFAHRYADKAAEAGQ